MSNTDKLDDEATAIRDSLILGTSGSLLLLFDFLVAASRTGAPKEVDIATAVFGKAENTDFSQDATVRVNIHRLRRRLDDFYTKSERPTRLTIPRGRYQLVAVQQSITDAAVLPPSVEPSGVSAARRWVALACLIAAINVFVWLIVWPRSEASAIDAVRARAPWSALLGNGRPLAIVVGDYYIFAEVDPTRGVDRMVRDYSVNSRGDLDDLMMVHPGLRQSYTDLNLTYLPAGTAQALRDLLSILVRTDAERAHTRIILASQLTPTTLKIANIVYVGYFSGLGPLLKNPVFAGSRFSVGATWDELVDGSSGRHYHSDEGGPDNAGGDSRDFAYVSSFSGVDGNRFVTVAGTRDAGLMQAAAAVSTTGSLDEMHVRAGQAPAFEALYEVQGVGRVNMGGKLAIVAPLAANRIWRSSDKIFPSR